MEATLEATPREAPDARVPRAPGDQSGSSEGVCRPEEAAEGRPEMERPIDE